MDKKIKILYAEDNATAALIYSEILEDAGFSIEIAKDGNEAWDLYQHRIWDLILLDMDIPGKDGHELIRLIRENGGEIPIIILSSLNHNHALYEGADDYLVKGCSIDEVKARIDKAIARVQKSVMKKNNGLFYISPFVTFNKSTRQLTIKGKKEELKSMESRILWLFCIRINETVTYTEMCENLWGFHSTDKEKSLTRYICLLNKKLTSIPTVYIQNDFGIGYKLVSE